MADIKWIKLDTDLFNNRKIKQIKKLPEGKSMLLIWINLLCLAGSINDNGLVYFTKDIPYTEETLATEFEEDIVIVRNALNTFQRFGMLEIVENFLLVTNWDKYQNVQSLEKIRIQTRERVAKHREKQKLLLECNVTSNVTVTDRNALDKKKKEEEDIDIYNVDSIFETFWKEYPRKESKVKAKEWFSKNKPSKELLEQMIHSLQKFKKTEQWQNKKFIPHPTTWLNGRRWEDEVDVEGLKHNPYKNKKVAPVPDWYDKYKTDLKNAIDKKKKEEALSEEELKELSKWAN